MTAIILTRDGTWIVLLNVREVESSEYEIIIRQPQGAMAQTWHPSEIVKIELIHL